MLISKVPSFPSKQEESIVERIKGALPLVGSFARISKALNGSPPTTVEQPPTSLPFLVRILSSFSPTF